MCRGLSIDPCCNGGDSQSPVFARLFRRPGKAAGGSDGAVCSSSLNTPSGVTNRAVNVSPAPRVPVVDSCGCKLEYGKGESLSADHCVSRSIIAANNSQSRAVVSNDALTAALFVASALLRNSSARALYRAARSSRGASGVRSTCASVSCSPSRNGSRGSALQADFPYDFIHIQRFRNVSLFSSPR